MLFSNLTPDDAVVAFNYDPICDITLYQLGILTQSSFEGLGFSDVIILNEKESKGGVKLLHLHGSFNWWTDINKNGSHGVYYNLLSEECKSNRKGNSPYPLILPFKQKKVLYESIPIYKRHIDEFLKLIEESTIIYIVGKTFDNSDNELNSMILEKSKKLPKKLYLINHHFKDKEFREFHENLFNATYVQGWTDLKQYYDMKD